MNNESMRANNKNIRASCEYMRK